MTTIQPGQVVTPASATSPFSSLSSLSFYPVDDHTLYCTPGHPSPQNIMVRSPTTMMCYRVELPREGGSSGEKKGDVKLQDRLQALR